MSDFTSSQGSNGEISPVLSKADNSVYQPLLNMAVPDLYQKNTFRMLGLPTNSDSREIRRQIEKWKFVIKNPASLTIEGPLHIGSITDPDALQEISHGLKDPEYRLLQELFWFWRNSSDSNDPAIAALTSGDVSVAADMWSSEHSAEMNGKDVRRHNLAVLYHAMALDYEIMSASNSWSDETTTDCEHVWKKAYEYWKSVLDGEGLWSELATRIRELDDHRLATGTARSIRATLPAALLSINAKLAVQAASNGRGEDCARQIRVMQHSGLGQDAIEGAKRSAVQPILKRLDAICKKASADADADKENADKVASWIIEHAIPLLEVLSLVIGEGQLTRDKAYDKVALAGLSCIVTYGNETEDWRVALELLEKITHLPAGASAHSRMNKNLEIIRNNVKDSICWFCGKNAKEDKHSVEVKMHGNVRETLQRVTWNHITITVGRCASCKEIHDSHETKVFVVAIGLAAIGLVISLLAGLEGFSIAVALFCFFVGVIVGEPIVNNSSSPDEIKPLSDQMEYPRIKELKAEGWQLGERPPNVEG